MIRSRQWMYTAALCVFVTFTAGNPSRPAAHDRTSQVTWTTDVRPIVQLRCLGCHQAGGFGSISLETYEDARTWAKGIREAVLDRRMPPWPAARGFGDFSNDRSLTPIEIELLTAWADGLTPLGPPVSEAPAPAAVRPFDLVVRMPAAHAVSGSIERFELPTGLTQDRWITGWEFTPGNRGVVEQAVVSIAPATLMGVWTPGDNGTTYPAGVAQRLPAGSRLVLELHYRRSSAPETDRSAIALTFGSAPAHELRHRSLDCGVSTLDRDIEALAVTPKAAHAGAAIEMTARRSDGTVDPLAVVPRYEPAYPVSYRLRTGMRLRKGTTIDLRSSSPECTVALEFVER
jgi:hypothetical protein